jgi:hypothetical protein
MANHPGRSKRITAAQIAELLAKLRTCRKLADRMLRDEPGVHRAACEAVEWDVGACIVILERVQDGREPDATDAP